MDYKKFYIEITLLILNYGYVQSVDGIKGFNIELQCSITSTDARISWWKNTTTLSEETKILGHVTPDEFRERLSITGNHAIGEYHLTIAAVKKSDVGEYSCYLSGNPTPRKVQLSVIEGPTSTTIANKTQNNKLVGTEEQKMLFRCTAVSEDPLPDMVLQIKNENFTVNSSRTIQHIIQTVDRTYDGAAVICLAGYQRFHYFEVTDSATIYLRLKPSSPTFSPDSVVILETEQLSVTCTSTGSRPAATERQWTIGNTSITYDSVVLSPIPDHTKDTYTVKSTLKYNVSRNDNGKTLSCGFKNEATSSFITGNRTMNIKFAPSVSVENKTYMPIDDLRTLSCNTAGNPANYSFSKWQHKSKYGKVIRRLDGNNILTLPNTSIDARYQDAGEYVCTVSNGIKDKDGNDDQQASGFLVSKVSPVFLDGIQQTKLGQTKNSVEIQVNVYSIPKYKLLEWKKGSSQISSSLKYTLADDPGILKDTFHGTEVQVDGYRLTLTIHDLMEQDFVNYTLTLKNDVGQTQHMVTLLSASPPEIPTNFTHIGATESTVTLQWLPAYDGGHEQVFIVEYRTSGSTSWEKAHVPKTVYASNDELQTYTLSGLKDGTSYEIRVYAENKFNSSNATDIVTVSTIENSGQGAVIGAVIGVLVVVVVIVVIVTVVIMWRRRDGNGAKKIQRFESESEGEDGMKDNISYKSVDTDSKTQVESEYAEVQKPHDVYAEVNKPKPQKNTKDKNPKVKSPGKKKQKKKAMNNNSAASEYDSQSEYANAGPPTGGYKNADGLQYADITFSNQPNTKTGKSVIHGLDERTIYCDVDHTKKAPPPPQEGAYELTQITQGKKY